MVSVSVIVPVYNVEKYLQKCLDTLVNQTLENMEIIVVNDGAKDHSQDIIDSFAAKYPQIVSLVKENGGLSDARNYGLPYAKGEYIGFVDSDDYVDLDMYELLYKKAKLDDSDIVECNLHHVFPDGSIDTEIGEEIQDKKQMLMNGRSVVWNKIYKRDWLLETGVTFPKGWIYEDVSFFCRLVPHIRSYSYIKEASIYYVQRGDSINNKQTLKTLDIIKVVNQVKDYYKEINAEEQYNDAMEFFFTRILLCSSFSRMCRIPDKKERGEALAKNWDCLVSNYPDWKRNQFLKEAKGRNGKFMRSINSFTYKIFGAILPKFLSRR